MGHLSQLIFEFSCMSVYDEKHVNDICEQLKTIPDDKKMTYYCLILAFKCGSRAKILIKKILELGLLSETILAKEKELARKNGLVWYTNILFNENVQPECYCGSH